MPKETLCIQCGEELEDQEGIFCGDCEAGPFHDECFDDHIEDEHDTEDEE